MIELLRQRRSVRRYLDRPVEPEKVALLKEALLRSPSSRSLDPWEYIVVDDPELLQKLSRAKPHGAAFVKNAPLAIAVCGDPEVCDVWVEDCSIASILLQMTALSLGLASCWVQIRKRNHDDRTSSEDYIKNLLNLPDTLRVLSLIAIGYPAETPGSIPEDQLKKEKLHTNGW